jgi:eukaryotic-like serine/threonine-protein kinase
MVPERHKIVRFADFVLDLRAGELLRAGSTKPFSLPDQPLQVLGKLLKLPGQMVSREELIQTLWPGGGFGDFDHGLNKAVNKLREALGDSAESPRFIETLARRGYRWMTPVEWVEQDYKNTLAAPVAITQTLGARQSLIGKKVSHYRILEVLGGGGMGVVYRAEDLKLGRCVALKFPGEELIGDHRALQRFEREARAISALDHTNICTIHEVEEHEGQPFIVMELLQGQTLRQRIEPVGAAQSTFSPSELLDFAIQIATGLEAAHQKGIIHRDVKPANIFITNRGEIKLLDFGLAKFMETGGVSNVVVGQQPETGPQDSIFAGVSQASMTLTGAMMGTACYMSPEQVCRELLDTRSDLFSFGVVLYEMATGRQPFRGDDLHAIHDAVLNNTPASPLVWNPGLPAGLGTIIGRALEKDRQKRYQSASEIISDLEQIHVAESGRVATVQTDSTPASAITVPARPHTWMKLGGAAIAAALLVLAAAVVIFLWRPVAPIPRVMRIHQVTDIGTVFPPHNLLFDGSRIYFASRENGEFQIKYVALNGGRVYSVQKPFPNTELHDLAPSGNQLLVTRIEVGFPQTNWRRSLWRLSLSAGTPERIGSIFADDAAWSPDGRTIVFTNEADRTLNLVDTDGSNARTLVTVPGLPFKPRWSPDGRLIRASVIDPKGDGITLWQFDIARKLLTRMLPDWDDSIRLWAGKWTVDGRYFLFAASDGGPRNIWVLPEERSILHRGSTRPVQLTDGPLSFSQPTPSRDGKTIYATGWQKRGQLMRYDAKLEKFEPYFQGISADQFSYSHDGKWMAYISYPEGTLTISRLDGSQHLQLTFPPMRAIMPRWSPDGSQIAFAASASPARPFKIYLVSARGGTAQLLAPGIGWQQGSPDWLKAGEAILFATLDESGETSMLHQFELKAGQDTVLPDSVGLVDGLVSPDGRTIAAVTFPAQNLVLYDLASHSKRLVAQLGVFPNWSADGQYVYYSTLMKGASVGPGETTVYRVRVSDGKIERLCPAPNFIPAGNWGYWGGPAPDGSPLVLRELGRSDIYALDLDTH